MASKFAVGSLGISVGLALGLIAQGPVAPTFDVASVRRLVGVPGGLNIQTSPTGLTVDHVTLGSVIRWAYGLRPARRGRSPVRTGSIHRIPTGTRSWPERANPSRWTS